MYLLTKAWSLNRTSLAMKPERSAMTWESGALTPTRQILLQAYAPHRILALYGIKLANTPVPRQNDGLA